MLLHVWYQWEDGKLCEYFDTIVKILKMFSDPKDINGQTFNNFETNANLSDLLSIKMYRNMKTVLKCLFNTSITSGRLFIISVWSFPCSTFSFS